MADRASRVVSLPRSPACAATGAASITTAATQSANVRMMTPWLGWPGTGVELLTVGDDRPRLSERRSRVEEHLAEPVRRAVHVQGAAAVGNEYTGDRDAPSAWVNVGESTGEVA